MIERFLIFIVRVYLTLAVRFYFNKIEIHGREHLKDAKPILFAANHQNAFMDGLLVAIVNYFPINIFIRASVFKKKWAAVLLRFLRLMPVYRVRDGWDSLGKNQEQFNDSINLFLKNESVMLFPEGNHGEQRKLRTLSRGFTKIPFEVMKQQPHLKLHIIPVGINYSDFHAFNSRVSIYYGKPILASDYFVEPIARQATLLKEKVTADLKQLITHIENDDRYNEIYSKLIASNPDFLSPEETNERIRKIENGESLTSSRIKNRSWMEFIRLPLKPLAFIVNYPLLFGWRKFRKGIKDPVFITSLKFAYGISVGQFYYLSLAGISSIWIGWWCGFVYLGLLCSLKILRKPT
jgi:1-acyl-sn-glycerol-3-phosphate acyltransferase